MRRLIHDDGSATAQPMDAPTASGQIRRRGETAATSTRCPYSSLVARTGQSLVETGSKYGVEPVIPVFCSDSAWFCGRPWWRPGKTVLAASFRNRPGG